MCVSTNDCECVSVQVRSSRKSSNLTANRMIEDHLSTHLTLVGAAVYDTKSSKAEIYDIR